jgi:26S proteasome regulatory subunit N5
VLLEKQTRLGADMRSNSRILRHMVKLAFESRNWNVLNETIVVMSKKRALIKFAIKNMVQDCCEMIDQISLEEERNRLIETLRTVTAGKIYVEVERARLTKRVVEKLEKEGKYDEAWNNLIELQVETFGSMEIKEKVVLHCRVQFLFLIYRSNSCSIKCAYLFTETILCGLLSLLTRSAPSSSMTSPRRFVHFC